MNDAAIASMITKHPGQSNVDGLAPLFEGDVSGARGGLAAEEISWTLIAGGGEVKVRLKADSTQVSPLVQVGRASPSVLHTVDWDAKKHCPPRQA